MPYSTIIIEEALEPYIDDSVESESFSLSVENLSELDLAGLSSDTLIVATEPTNTGEKVELDKVMEESGTTVVIWGDVESPDAVNANCIFTPTRETVEALRNEGLPSFCLPFTTADGESNLRHIIKQANMGADGEYLYHYGTLAPVSHEESKTEETVEEGIEDIEDTEDTEDIEETEVSHVKGGTNALIIGGRFFPVDKAEAIIDRVDKSRLDAIILVSSDNHLKEADMETANIPVYKSHVDIENILEPCVGDQIDLSSAENGGGGFNGSSSGFKFVAPFLMDIIKAQGHEFDNYVYVEECSRLDDNEFREICSILNEVKGLSDTSDIIVRVFDFDTSKRSHVDLLSPDNEIGMVCSGMLAWSPSPNSFRFFNRFKLALGWSVLTGNIDNALEMAVNTAIKAITCVEVGTGESND